MALSSELNKYAEIVVTDDNSRIFGIEGQGSF